MHLSLQLVAPSSPHHLSTQSSSLGFSRVHPPSNPISFGSAWYTNRTTRNETRGGTTPTQSNPIPTSDGSHRHTRESTAHHRALGKHTPETGSVGNLLLEVRTDRRGMERKRQLDESGSRASVATSKTIQTQCCKRSRTTKLDARGSVRSVKP